MITQAWKMSVMFGKACKPWILLVLLCRQVLSGIAIQSQLLIHFVGENAHFRWSSDDNSTLFAATWGIRKGDIADPVFINVDILSNKTKVNLDLNPLLSSRLSYDGDLRIGRAWFVLKNVTINDTNEYVVRISEDAKRVLPYTIALVVEEREKTEKYRATTTREPKGLKGEQAVTSPQTRMWFQTSKKGTKKPLSTNGNLQLQDAIIALCVLVPVLLLITAIMVISRKRHACKKGEENRAAPSVKRLLKVKTNVGEDWRKIFLEGEKEGVDHMELYTKDVDSQELFRSSLRDL